MNSEYLAKRIKQLEHDNHRISTELDSLKASIEEAEWPKKGDGYFKITGAGYIDTHYWCGDSVDHQFKEIGNLYRTREEAETELIRLKIKTKVKRRILELNDGWVPDWSDSGDAKYFVDFISHDQNKFYVGCRYDHQRFSNWKYFKYEGFANAILEEFTEAELMQALL